MPRKRSTSSQKDHLMPVEFNPPWMKRMPPLSVIKLEAAKAALPIFGGTSTETESSSSESNADTKKTSTDSGGSESGGGDSPEVTPEKLQELTKQITELTTKNTELAQSLQGFQSKEDEARKAELGREEALTEDLTKAQQTIDAMDQIIKRLAVVNAIQGNDNLQFHNVDDVITKLDHGAYQLDVDLEAGKATASGIENELSRIAKEYEYLVKKPTLQNDENTTRRPRGTGNPPGPRPTNPTAATRRKELEAKWPVIAAGRATLG